MDKLLKLYNGIAFVIVVTALVLSFFLTGWVALLPIPIAFGLLDCVLKLKHARREALANGVTISKHKYNGNIVIEGVQYSYV